jgi:Na+/phosphate symporter
VLAFILLFKKTDNDAIIRAKKGLAPFEGKRHDMSKSVIYHMKKDMKEELLTLHEMIINAEDCISLLENAFIYNHSKLLDECNRKVNVIKKEVVEVAKTIKENADDNSTVGPFFAIPDHLSHVAIDIEKLSDHINKKIAGNILFSDKAINETTFLLQRLIEILVPASDFVLATNIYLGMYIRESQKSIGKMAMEYATLHEERLIKGVCNNAASSIYIGILDAIKNIAWHTKEIAEELAGK